MPIDHDKLKQRLASRSVTGWRTKPGENKIRILPPHSRYLDDWDTLNDLSIPYKMHFFKIEGRQTEVSRCLEEVKQPCPACTTWRAHRKTEDPGFKELAGNISPADQYLFNILDLNNIQGGIEYWASNWTCWKALMEYACNPQWGNLVDPADGIDFTVTMTPGAQSRTGHNQYSVMPSPQRTTIIGALSNIKDWKLTLDGLENQIPAPKKEEEIILLLGEMGFPTKGHPVTQPAVTPTTVSAPVDPPAPASSQPAAGGVVPLATAAAPQPVTAAPQPVTAAPQPVVAASPATTPATAAPPEVHYDPGPEYTPKMADKDRPVGVPRCYTDYKPEVHQCAPCPVVTECQMEFMGVQDS